MGERPAWSLATGEAPCASSAFTLRRGHSVSHATRIQVVSLTTLDCCRGHLARGGPDALI